MRQNESYIDVNLYPVQRLGRQWFFVVERQSSDIATVRTRNRYYDADQTGILSYLGRSMFDIDSEDTSDVEMRLVMPGRRSLKWKRETSIDEGKEIQKGATTKLMGHFRDNLKDFSPLAETPDNLS